MAEYIEREATIDEIEGTTWYHISCQKNLVEGAACEADALYKATDIYNVIKSAPTADVVEVRHGKWIEDGYYDEPCVCPNCGGNVINQADNDYLFEYCYKCGQALDWSDNNA